LWQSRTV